MILTRLKKAIAEQNWFAVGLEFIIVLLGVIIGFQVSIWGQGQADKAKGEAYLVQMVSDLQETQRLILVENAEAQISGRAAGMLVKEFDTSDRSPSDSLYTWLGQAVIVHGPLPILSTAEALVSTGDLNLIKDIEIRSAITTYLQQIRVLVEFQNQGTSIVLGRMGSLMEVVDVRQGVARLNTSIRTIWEEALHPVLLDATMPRDTNGVGTNVPDDLEGVFTNREAYALLTELAFRQADLSGVRAKMLSETEALIELIDSKS